MEMLATANLNILGASRFEFDGIRGVKVFAQKDADTANLNVIGIEVVEFSAEFDLFESLRGYSFPMEFKCSVAFGRASKGKAGAKIISATPLKVPAAPAPAPQEPRKAA